jgi:hypothetical protein
MSATPALGVISRGASLLVIVIALRFAWPIPKGGWYVALIVIPSLLFIWFPEKVDEYTFGTWQDGYRIDSHTPPILIAIVGWVILLVDASLIVSPDLIARLFGAV